MADYELYGISAEHIAPGGIGRAQFEPQRVSNFVLEVGVPGTTVDGLIESRAERIIALSVREFPMPEERTDRIELPYGNETRYVAGRTTFGEETLTCTDYIDVDTADIIYNWRRRVYNPGPDMGSVSGGGLVRGGVGLAYQYKSTGCVWWLGPDSSGGATGSTNQGQFSVAGSIPERRWYLYGMWPMSVRYGRGNMGASEANVIEVTFSVDRISRALSGETYTAN